MNANYVCFLIMPRLVTQLADSKSYDNMQQLVAKILWGLCDIQKPIGVSEYELTRALPDDLKSSLPTVEEIEAELSGEMRGLLEGGNGK